MTLGESTKKRPLPQPGLCFFLRKGEGHLWFPSPSRALPIPPPGRFRRTASLHVPPLRGAPHKGLQSGCGVPGFRGGGFLFCVLPPSPLVTTRFVFGAGGASCAAAPAYHPAGSFPFTAAPLRPPPPEKARRGPRAFLRRMSARPHAVLRSIKFEKRVDFSAVLPYNIRRE